MLINLGLEGVMVIGALGGALVLKYMPVGSPAVLYYHFDRDWPWSAVLYIHLC